MNWRRNLEPPPQKKQKKKNKKKNKTKKKQQNKTKQNNKNKKNKKTKKQKKPKKTQKKPQPTKPPPPPPHIFVIINIYGSDDLALLMRWLSGPGFTYVRYVSAIEVCVNNCLTSPLLYLTNLPYWSGY